MRKFYLFASMFAVVFAAQAQQDYDIRLIQTATSNEVEIEDFTYNDRGLMETRTYTNYLEALYLFDTHSYNELGQLVSITTEQDLSYSFDPTQLVPVYRIDYTYDEQGRIIVRENANAENGEMYPSARIVFTYDASGRLTREDTYWADEPDAPFYYVVKNYNSRGQLIKEVEYQQDWSVKGLYNLMGQLLYDYNIDGTLAKRSFYNATSTSNPEESLSLSNSEHFEYKDGDLTGYELHSGTGFVINRIEFNIDTSITADRIYYPYTMENSISRADLAKHKRLTEDVWSGDTNTGKLVLSHTINYTYEENPNGIRQIIGDNRPMNLTFDIHSRELNVSGADAGTSIRVVNAAGQTVKTAEMNNDSKVSLSDLPAGTYIAVVRKPGSTSTAQKFIVR